MLNGWVVFVVYVIPWCFSVGVLFVSHVSEVVGCFGIFWKLLAGLQERSITITLALNGAGTMSTAQRKMMKWCGRPGKCWSNPTPKHKKTVWLKIVEFPPPQKDMFLGFVGFVGDFWSFLPWDLYMTMNSPFGRKTFGVLFSNLYGLFSNESLT